MSTKTNNKKSKQKANIKKEIKESYKMGKKYYEEIEKTHREL